MFRVFAPDFCPNDIDIISAYDQVDQPQTSSLLHRRLKMELVCCTGKSSQIKDWNNLLLYNPHYLFYVVSLKDYYSGSEIPDSSIQVCNNHSHKNMLVESLNTFENLVNSELLDKSYSVFLVFNTCDIFYEKIKLFDLKHCFPEYEGGNDINCAITFIKDKFTKTLIEKNKTFKTHVINILDKNNVKEEYEKILDTIIPDAEKRGLVYQTVFPSPSSTTTTTSSTSTSTPSSPSMPSPTLSSSSRGPSSVLPHTSSIVVTPLNDNHLELNQTTNHSGGSLNDNTNSNVPDNISSGSSTTTESTKEGTSVSSSSKKSSLKAKLERKKETISKTAGIKKKKKGLCGVQSGYFEMQGRRKNMEDAHAMHDNLLEAVNGTASTTTTNNSKNSKQHDHGVCAYYAVYDGHGGTETSKALGPIVHKCVVETAAFTEGNYEQSLRDAYEQADKMVIPTCERSGSTAVSALIVDSHLYSANVGDSEAVLARSTGSSKSPTYEPILLTQKHLAKENDKEKQRITDLGGMIIFGRLFGSLAVTRSFGDKEYKEGEKKYVLCEPHLTSIELTPKDHFLILACDGLWEKVNYEEAVQMTAKLLKMGKTPTEISNALVQDSYDKGSGDNITALVVVFNWKS
eukprot:gene874-1093_t